MVILKFMLISIAISIGAYFGIALVLIASQWPEKKDMEVAAKGLNFEGVTKAERNLDIPLTEFTARDGERLYLRHISAKQGRAPLVIVIHGSGWHGGAYANLGENIATSGKFEVLIPDLRGHGPNTRRRSDISYIGQLEDDLADLIDRYRKPDQKVYMVGHSSGGGLVVRFAGGEYGDRLDKAVLLAPFLKYNAPTIRENSGGWAHVLTRRIIGLSMLNSVGVTALNKLPIIQFNFPRSILEGELGNTATSAYSFRLNTSYAPRTDYMKDIAKLPEFLLLVGANDEAFKAREFEPLMSSVTEKGTYEIIPSVNHLGLIDNPESLSRMIDYLKP